MDPLAFLTATFQVARAVRFVIRADPLRIFKWLSYSCHLDCALFLFFSIIWLKVDVEALITTTRYATYCMVEAGHAHRDNMIQLAHLLVCTLPACLVCLSGGTCYRSPRHSPWA